MQHKKKKQNRIVKIKNTSLTELKDMDSIELYNSYKKTTTNTEDQKLIHELLRRLVQLEGKIEKMSQSV